MKLIDYAIQSGYISGEKPETPQQKVTEYVIARISDYAEDCDINEDVFFASAMSENNELAGIKTLYENLIGIGNLDELEFSNSAFVLLNTELDEIIISNMEKACVKFYDTMLSSDIEHLVLNYTWDDLIKHITTN